MLDKLQSLWLLISWPPVWITLLLILAITAFAYCEQRDYNRLMAQCLADGKKEYECRAILKQGDTTYIPIVIPVR